jgi:hypothetical protein
MAWAYLVVERGRREPWVACGVGLLAPVALCLTPAGLGTIAYYHGVLTNVAAQQGAGMWGGLSLTAPLDVVLVLAVLALGVSLRSGRVRLRAWEWIMLGALGVATIQAARQGGLVALCARRAGGARDEPLAI